MKLLPVLVRAAAITTTFALCLRSATSSPTSTNHGYNAGDRVPLFVNKVGPLHNPSETYWYYDLPFCKPDNVILKKETLGEVLNGDRLSGALYELEFQKDKTGETLCVANLNRDDVAKFRDAVVNDFYFQMYYDNLPLWGFIGRTEEWSSSLGGKELKFYLFARVQFIVLYNENQVVEISAFSDPNHIIDITDDVVMDVKFTYSVSWNATSLTFENRMDKYSMASYHPVHQQIHLFTFANSAVIVVLLMGLLMVLFMRHLRNDLRKDEEEDKEVGWKYLHGDVFRYPKNMSFFCAVLGTGTQLLTLILLLFILAFVGILYPYNRGTLWTSLVLVHALTSLVGGYSACSFHIQFSRRGWERSVVLTGILYPCPVFAMLITLNAVSVSYHATAALPFGTIMIILLLYTFLALPLVALGGLIGYWFRSEFHAPSAIKRFPREIPPLAWYRTTPCQMFLGGLVTFSAIVLELHQLYTTLWGYKITTRPIILFAVFVILLLLTAMLSVGMTYIQLSVEDHEWWWRSVLQGGSPAVFMYIYCIYFYAKSNMTGLLQYSFFFGYNACICYALFLILGTVSFRAAFIFVGKIYRAVKSE